ncbi:hypothetical protein SAMN04488098_101054 [Alkalibacterium thalassium]|uniref:Uncharacterized protein n=1 Tax=Alkalibacterium thalassium TaxID=426701 RepID=A0A1G8YPK9_9LACT|nr:hypothetical protein SAMN04488098_101054 [Alkalibacterium thalassium]
MYHIVVYGAFIRFYDCRTVHKFIYGTFICLIYQLKPAYTEKEVILPHVRNKITSFLIVKKDQYDN